MFNYIMYINQPDGVQEGKAEGGGWLWSAVEAAEGRRVGQYKSALKSKGSQ